MHWLADNRPQSRWQSWIVLGLAVAVAAAVMVLATSGRSAGAAEQDVRLVEPMVEPFSAMMGNVVAAAAQTASAMSAAATPDPETIYCPVPAASFTDTWGQPRSGGRRHLGTDLMAPYGSPVVAVRDGVVTVSNSRLGGLGFYLQDRFGNRFFGAHLATLTATGRVQAGQVIGTVGTTGNASTPHVHFEVQLAGQGNRNPYPFVANWCGLTEADPFAA